MTFAITAQYPIFADSDGTPLESGYVWIGDVNDNPITNPLTVYWDSALKYPAAQPIRTLAGAPNRNGSPSALYINSDFSIMIKDKNLNQIYYSPNGNKNFLSSSLDFYKNYILNGGFLIQQYQAGIKKVDLFDSDVADYTPTVTRNPFLTTEDRPEDTSKFYMELGLNGLGAAVDSSYVRYVHAIEDVMELAGKQITLSWYDRYNTLLRYAVSLSQIMPSAATIADVKGIGAQIFYPGTSWIQRKITVDLPTILDLSIDFDDPEDIAESYLLINFWLAAGFDFNSETGSLGNVTDSALFEVDIAEVRLNQGPIVKTTGDLNFAQTLHQVKRYYERSNSIYDNPLSMAANGEISFVAGGANTTIPGFRFTREKRTQSPTVHVYSSNSGTIDTVYRVGTGDVAVANYHDVNSTGVGYIELSGATVANDVYQYHWTADDQFSV